MLPCDIVFIYDGSHVLFFSLFDSNLVSTEMTISGYFKDRFVY